jgi:hypothetical protein
MNLPVINPPALFRWCTHITMRSSEPSIEPRIRPFIHNSIQGYINPLSHTSIGPPIHRSIYSYLLTREAFIQQLIDASPICSRIHQSIHTRPGVRKHHDQNMQGTEQGSQSTVCCSLAVSATSVENACVGQTLNGFGGGINCSPIGNSYLAVHHCAPQTLFQRD